MSNEWHGMAHDQIEANQDKVPPQPEGKAVAVLEGNGFRYHRVHFSGNYGFGCGQYQTFDRIGITEDEAGQMAWAAFGLCGHTVEFQDAQGNRVR